MTHDRLRTAPAHQLAEIIGGRIVTRRFPTLLETRVASQLLGMLARAVEGRTPRWSMLFQPELHVGGDLLVPSVCAWRDVEPAPQRLFGPAPEWLCDVVSAAFVDDARSHRLSAYARAGVAHVWLIDPLARTLEIYRFADGHPRRHRRIVADDTIDEFPFDASPLELRALWTTT